MFFLVLTSHSVGRPLADDTMFRSGVPPHIGQSPVFGSDAPMRTAPANATAIAAALISAVRCRLRDFAPLWFSCFLRAFLPSWPFVSRQEPLLVLSQLHIVDLGPEFRRNEEA